MPVLQQKRDRDGAAAVAEMQALRRRLLHLLRLHRVGAPAAGVNPSIFRSPSTACSGRPPCARWGWERRPSSGSLPPRARPPFMPAEVYHDSIAACDTTATGCTQPWIKKPDCQAYRVLLFCLSGTRPQESGVPGRGHDPVRVRPHQQTPSLKEEYPWSREGERSSRSCVHEPLRGSCQRTNLIVCNGIIKDDIALGCGENHDVFGHPRTSAGTLSCKEGIYS